MIKRGSAIFFIGFLLGVNILSIASADPCGPVSTYNPTTKDPWIPTFSDPTKAEGPIIFSAANGAWSQGSTWQGGVVPGPTNVVVITHDVLYDASVGDVHTIVVYPSARLHFKTDMSTQLRVVTLQVLCNGTLEIGTESDPILLPNTARIIFKDAPMNTTIDPAQYGHGLLVIGNIKVHGAVLSDSFMRLDQEPLAGNTSVHLEAAVSGWNVGDRVALPGTRQHDYWEKVPQPIGRNNLVETAVITSVSGDGRTISLDRALGWDHKGARYRNGTIRFLPHLMNLTRNVRFESENPAGVRAHFLATYRASVDIRYAWFKDMGRTTNADIDSTTFDGSGNATHVGTNQIGRYPIHTHHLMGPTAPLPNGYQFNLIGNSIDGGNTDHDFKWGMAIHNSHYGLIQKNVVYNMKGTGIMLEDGSEKENVLEKNMVCWIWGSGGRADHQNSQLGIGREGNGFYANGPFSRFRQNVAANCYSAGVYGYGFTISMNLMGNGRVPTSQGQDENGYATVLIPANPLAQFEDNEVYGSESGMTLWWAGAQENNPVGTGGVVKNLRVWHFDHYGMFQYASNRLTVDGLVVQGDWGLYDSNNGAEAGIITSDYSQMDYVVQNSDIRATGFGIEFTPNSNSTTNTYQNNTFQTRAVDIAASQIWSVSDDQRGHTPRTMIMINNTHLDGGYGGKVINFSEGYGDKANLIVSDRMFVYSYNGNPNANYRIYNKGQRATANLEKSVPGYAGLPNIRIVGCPEEKSPGVPYTNAECFALFGVARSGEISPCVDGTCSNAIQEAGITGDVFPANLPPTVIVLSPRANDIVSGTSVNVSYQLFGATLTVASVKLQIDSDTIKTDTDLDGRYTFTNIQPGAHTLKVYLADSSGNQIANTLVTLSFRTTMNQYPVANAGQDQTILVTQQASLAATASDDGQPNPPAALTYAWSKVSGPGSVTFDAPTALQTNARFSQTGEYVLGFAANDSELQTTANVTITVNSAGGGGDGAGGGGSGGGGAASIAAKKGAFHPENGDSIEIPDSSAEIYNRQGAKVRTLSGSGAIVLWDGKNDAGKILPSGIYLYKSRNNKTGKVVLIK